MDSQQQFLRPAQHPFYVKKPIVIEGNHALDGQGFQPPHGKPSAYSVDLSWYGYGKKKHRDQLSEPGKPYPKNHSLSLRDVFEKAILSGEVAIDSPEEENGAPGFITSSLPRPVKINHSPRRTSPSRHIQPNVHVGTNNYKGSTDYFLDSSSESETDSVDGRHNEAYIDEISSTVSDEMFKSTSEGPSSVPDEDCTHIQPLPNVLDVSGHVQATRSALSGLFKPKFKENSSRVNNVHRNPIWDHNEVMGSTGRSHRRSEPEILAKLPRTPFPVEVNTNRHSSPVKVDDHISHNKYLPSQVRSSRRSPRIGRSSPRLGRNRHHMLEDETEFDEIRPASPSNSRLSSPISDRPPVEQFEMEEPPWVKELQRARRKRRNYWIAVSVTIIVFFVIAAIVGILLGVYLKEENITTPTMMVATTITTINTATTTAVTSQDITLAGQMRITSKEFTPDLEIPQSAEYKQLSDDFCGAMGAVFADEESGYQNCSVTKFSEGSIICDFNLLYKISKNQTADDLRDQATRSITKALNESSFGNFTAELKAMVVKKPTEITPTITTTATTTATTQINPTTQTAEFNVTEPFTTTTSLEVETTTSLQTTTTTVTTTPKPPECADGMRAGKQYIDDQNCTIYRMCSLQSANRVLRIPCSQYQMYRQTGQHEGQCVPCDTAVCDMCTAAPFSNSTRTEVSETTDLQHTESVDQVATNTIMTVTTATIRAAETPITSTQTLKTAETAPSVTRTSTVQQAHLTNPSITAQFTTQMTLLSNLLTLHTTVLPANEQTISSQVTHGNNRTISIEGNCAKFAFFSPYVESDCQCDHMYDAMSAKCVICDADICSDCVSCN